MPTYMITNRVPDGYTGSVEAAAWTAWFERLVDHLADRDNPSSPAPQRATAAPAPCSAGTPWSPPVTLDTGNGGTRLTLGHYDPATSELRDAHQVALETYLRRLAIRAARGDPGPDPPLGPRPAAPADSYPIP